MIKLHALEYMDEQLNGGHILEAILRPMEQRKMSKQVLEPFKNNHQPDGRLTERKQ